MRFIVKRLLITIFSFAIVVLIASSAASRQTVTRSTTTIGHLSRDRGHVSSAIWSECPVAPRKAANVPAIVLARTSLK